MNDKQKLEKIVDDAENIKIPSNEFFHRHFLIHEAGKSTFFFYSEQDRQQWKKEKESEIERERKGERKRERESKQNTI